MKKKPVRRHKISFKQFVDMYLNKKVRRSEDSQVKLVRAINKHLVDLFEKNLNEISTDDVRNVIANISGNAIAARMQELLQSIFNYAIDMGYVKNNPVAALEKIKQNRRVRPLNKAGLKRLMRAIEMEENVVYRSAFYMLIYSFAPRSKVFAMSWEDLDFNHFMWNNIPLSDRASVLLQELSQYNDWVFPGYGGTHIIDPRLAWKRVAKNAGMPNLTMDDVYKFLMRQVVWAPDKEDLRANFNELLDELLSDDEY
jgi:integrase